MMAPVPIPQLIFFFNFHHKHCIYGFKLVVIKHFINQNRCLNANIMPMIKHYDYSARVGNNEYNHQPCSETSLCHGKLAEIRGTVGEIGRAHV